MISPAHIAASDVDTPASALVFTASNVVNGHFELISAPGLAITAFTQADIDAGQVRFVHDGSAAAPAFEVSVSDGMFNIGPFAGVVSFADTGTARDYFAGGHATGRLCAQPCTGCCCTDRSREWRQRRDR